jgi:SNF2 family DNA or RNA helicase
VSIRKEGGRILRESPDGDQLVTAAQVYDVWFEGKQSPFLARSQLEESGLSFSGNPLTPVLVIWAETPTPGEPLLYCGLGGAVGGETILAAPNADYVISAGTWYPLPAGTLEEFEELLGRIKARDRTLSLGQYLELLGNAEPFRVEDRAAALLTASTLAGQLGGSLPVGLVATPYPYQKTGIAWLGFMARHGVGSILGDEMGLGKTLQVIGVLVAEIAGGRRPNLVICPATLLENWRRELMRFAPGVGVMVHAGASRVGSERILARNDVVLTSFDTLAGDISIFQPVEWNVVAADEAQNLRNPTARRTVRAKMLKRRVTIAVTGTPMENSLKDLWSITDLVLPGYLGTLADFERAHPDTETAGRALEPRISAVMLRRRVAEVARDLPPRLDVPVPLRLDQASVDAYEEIRAEIARLHPDRPDLLAIVRLRMFCSHPWAAGKFTNVRDAAGCSAKLERCLEIIEEVARSGAKALVFTSFNEVSEILEESFASRFRIPVARINGSVPVIERQPLVDAFSGVEGPAVLVLNPKAAGTGLNITAASHVIHYNLEWNPAVEDQASARAHRRGQTLPVTVHRLFYVDTVEEVIDDRVARKRALAMGAVVGSSGDEDDLADLVRALQRRPR